MYTTEVIYQGELRTKATHLQSGNFFITDAPTDNNGRGEYFSPTDLVAAALGSCMLTIMGIEANKLGIDITGTSAKVTKKMGINPRRIVALDVEINITNPKIIENNKMLLENAARNCPVAKSINPNIEQNINFKYVN